VGDALLASGPLNNVRLGRAEAILAMDTSLLSLESVLSISTSELECANALIVFLRDQRAITDDDLCLPEGAGLPALRKRLHRALDRLQAPDPEFAVSSPYRIVRSIRELREVKSVFTNSVRLFGHGYWYRPVSGAAGYVTSDTLLAALRRNGIL
jgi:hypothetical protein